MFYLYFAAMFSLDYHFIIFHVIFFFPQSGYTCSAPDGEFVQNKRLYNKTTKLEVFHCFGGEPNKTLCVNPTKHASVIGLYVLIKLIKF